MSPLFYNVDLRSANFAGADLRNTIFVVNEANLANINFTNANLSAHFHTFLLTLQTPNFQGATCPDGTSHNENNNCETGFSTEPTPLLLPVYFPAKFEEQITTYQTSIRYIGIHEFIPGVATNDMNNYLIINEQSYRALVGDQFVNNLKSSNLDYRCRWNKQ